MRVKKIPA